MGDRCGDSMSECAWQLAYQTACRMACRHACVYVRRASRVYVCATCVCAGIQAGRHTCASERAYVRAYGWHVCWQVCTCDGSTGVRHAGLYKKLEILRQFPEMDTPHARFKPFPYAHVYVNSIYNPIPPIVQLCWIMLVYVEFMLV